MRPLAIIRPLLALLLTGLVCSASGTDQAELRRRIQLLEKEGNYPAAVPFYQQLHQLAPGDSIVVHGLARALDGDEQYQQVVDLLEPWLNRHPDDLQARLRLGDAHHGLDRDDRALKIWRQALDAGPITPERYLQLSDRCQAAKLYTEAAHILLDGRAALRQDRLFSWELAQLYLRLEDYPRAIDAYLLALQQHPKRYPVAERRLLQLMETPTVAAKVLKALKTALGSTSDPLQAAMLASSCALEGGEGEEGYQILAALVEQTEAVELLFQYASRCEGKGYSEVAARAYALFAEKSPDSPYLFQAKLRQAAIVADHRDYPRAIALYRQLSRKYPNHPEVLEAIFQLGRLQLEELDDPEAARASFQAVLQASRRDQWTYKALELLAEVALRQDDFEEAREQLEKLQFWSSRSAYLARFHQAELLYFRLDFGGATKILEELLAEDSGHELANDALVLLLRCEELQDQTPALEHFVGAQLLERQHRSAKAVESWNWLAAHAPPAIRELSLLTRARIREERREPKIALALYQQLIDQHSRGSHVLAARIDVARLYEEQDDLDRALKAYETALLSAPDDARVAEIRRHIQRLRRLTGKESG